MILLDYDRDFDCDRECERERVRVHVCVRVLQRVDASAGAIVVSTSSSIPFIVNGQSTLGSFTPCRETITLPLITHNEFMQRIGRLQRYVQQRQEEQ